MEQLFTFIKNSSNIITEFVYVNDRGVAIEGGNHTVHILESLSLDDETKRRLAKQLPFGDEQMYTTAIFDENIDIAVLSLFTDPNLGLYKEKSSGAIVAFGEYTNDLTDETQWDKFISNECFTANCKFTMENLQFIRDHYTFLGRLTAPEIIKNLEVIYSHLAENALLVLCMGSETAYVNNSQPAYADRHLYNRELNTLVKQWAESKNRVALLNTNDFILDQSAFTNNINHFTKIIYYKMCNRLVNIINRYMDEKVTDKSKSHIKIQSKKEVSRVYNLARRIVRKIKSFLE